MSSTVLSEQLKDWVSLAKDFDANDIINPTLNEILNCLNQPELDIDRLSEAIRKDAVLSVRLLSIVNSSFFGFPRQIANIGEAIVLLGAKKLKSLVYTSAVAQISGDDTTGVTTMHCICVATIARRIALKLKLDSELCYLSGLFHDISLIINPLKGINAEEVKSNYYTTVGTTSHQILDFLLLPPEILEAIEGMYRKTQQTYSMVLAIAHNLSMIYKHTHHYDISFIDVEYAFRGLPLSPKSLVALLPEIEEDLSNLESFWSNS